MIGTSHPVTAVALCGPGTWVCHRTHTLPRYTHRQRFQEEVAIVMGGPPLGQVGEAVKMRYRPASLAAMTSSTARITSSSV